MSLRPSIGLKSSFSLQTIRNFPSWRTSQSKCEKEWSGAEGDLMRFTVHYTAFCLPLYILGKRRQSWSSIRSVFGRRPSARDNSRSLFSPQKIMRDSWGTFPRKTGAERWRSQKRRLSVLGCCCSRRAGLCIIYETRHILRLNICWFVKSTNVRSISLTQNTKRRLTSNWWGLRLVTSTLATVPSPPSFLLPGAGRGGRRVGAITVPGEGGAQGHSFPSREDDFQEGPGCLLALASLCVVFHLKVPTTDEEQNKERKVLFIRRGGIAATLHRYSSQKQIKAQWIILLPRRSTTAIQFTTEVL